MRRHVVPELGDWLLADDDGNRYMVVVKDIDAFVGELIRMKKLKRIAAFQVSIDELINHVDFAPITTQRNGKVLWQGGRFCEGNS